MSARADLALVLNSLVWGTTFVVVKAALADVTPVLFLALRFALAALVLLALFHRHLRSGRDLWPALHYGALLGVFLFSGYLFQTLGLRLTTAPKSAFVTGLCTAMVPLLASLVNKSRPAGWEITGVSLAAVGLGLMTLQGESLAMSRGDVLTLVCAAAFAMHIVATGRYAGIVRFELLSAVQVTTAAALAWALFCWIEPPVIRFTQGVWLAIFITGVLGTAMAFTIQAWAQRHTSPTRTALIYALEPIFAWLTSYLIAGETLRGRAQMGAGLILTGVLLVELKPVLSERHP